MLIKIGIAILLSILSAIFYRMGGADRPYRSWHRDWVCPAFALGTFFLFFTPNHWWGYLLSIPVYALMGGALSTYWDWLFKYDNYYAHAFFVGLSFFPFCFVGLAWWILAIQIVLMTAMVGLWSKWQDNAVVEELGRGFFICIFRI